MQEIAAAVFCKQFDDISTDFPVTVDAGVCPRLQFEQAVFCCMRVVRLHCI
jgi:hypothetical protein